jgi:hypothetical protein
LSPAARLPHPVTRSAPPPPRAARSCEAGSFFWGLSEVALRGHRDCFGVKTGSRTSAPTRTFLVRSYGTAGRTDGPCWSKPVGVLPGWLWVYGVDRPWSGPESPAAVYFYIPDRKAERPAAHFQDFRGVLQVDGYAGVERLASIVLAHGQSVNISLAPNKLRDMTDKHPKRPRFWRFCMSGQCWLASNQMDRWC